jgi:hypothetical protein
LRTYVKDNAAALVALLLKGTPVVTSRPSVLVNVVPLLNGVMWTVMVVEYPVTVAISVVVVVMPPIVEVAVT